MTREFWGGVVCGLALGVLTCGTADLWAQTFYSGGNGGHGLATEVMPGVTFYNQPDGSTGLGVETMPGSTRYEFSRSDGSRFGMVGTNMSPDVPYSVQPGHGFNDRGTTQGVLRGGEYLRALKSNALVGERGPR